MDESGGDHEQCPVKGHLVLLQCSWKQGSYASLPMSHYGTQCLYEDEDICSWMPNLLLTIYAIRGLLLPDSLAPTPLPNCFLVVPYA